jgi:hypothetical protein
VAVAALLLVACWAAYDGSVDGNPDLFHEGERLAHYDAIVRGRLPFRDYFVPHGLGEDVLKGYVACRLLGPSVASLRRVGSHGNRGLLPWLGFLSVLLAAYAHLSNRALARSTAIVLAFLLVDPSDRQMLGFVAVAFMGVYFVRRRLRWLVAAGIAASLAALYSLEVGLYTVASIAVTLGAEWLLAPRSTRVSAWQPLAALGAGVSAIFVPFLGWCAANGIVNDLGHNLWVQICLRSQLWPSHYPDLTPKPGTAIEVLDPLPFGQTVVLYYLFPTLLIVTLAWSLWWYRRMTPAIRQRLLLASVLACCFWGTVVGRPDRWHVAFAVPAAVFLAAVALDAHLPGPAVFRRALAVAGLVVLATLGAVGQGGALVRKIGASLHHQGGELVTSSLPRLQGMRLEPDLRDILGPLVAEIDRLTTPKEPILNLTPYGLLLFLAERESAVRYENLAHFGASPRLRDEVLETLLRRGAPPRCVLREADKPLVGDGLASWIDANYGCVAAFGPFEVLAPMRAATGKRP